MIIGKSAARSSRRNVGDRPKTMCRQKLRNEVPESGKPALSCHPNRACKVNRKRPVLARLSESALSFHIGFSAALENLRWVRNISRTKPDASGGRFTSRRGSAAACRSAATAGFITSQAQHLHAGCVPSRTRKRLKSVRKTLKSLQKPSTKSVGDNAGEDRSS